MTMPGEWSHRVNHWRSALPALFYRELLPIEWQGFVTRERLTPAEAARRRFRPMPAGTKWGEKWEYGWFRARVRLPAAAAGQRIAFAADLWGREGYVSREAVVYANGELLGGRDDQHQHLTLARRARGGETFELLLEAYSGHGPTNCGGGPARHGVPTVPEPQGPQARIGGASVGIWEEDVYQLWLDVETLYQLREHAFDRESLRQADIDEALQQLTLLVDPELPREAMLETVRAGRALLRPVLAARNGSTAAAMHCFGHSHIDVAWLWPLRETESKCLRTFGTQLALMAEYPEYKFLQSQPHLYAMVKANAPELYARIRRAVQRGQWIADGGMWVEADTNITGGESLVRQFLHGKRFFRQEFGVENELMWLPDVFGYSAALPQIMQGCGIRYFSTQKIFWAYHGGDPFPYNAFWWEGLDGTRTLAYIHNDYNSHTGPQAVLERWKERVQKGPVHRGRLMPFGFGDGGGGPTRNHIEFLRRQKDLETVPRCTIAPPAEFFKALDAQRLPTWVGELYFQAHRGTYTSQARTKLGNRRSEFGLREAELWGALAQAAGAGPRPPAEELRELWQAVLLNQFHDIIPGSSIHRVYEEAEAAYARVIERSARLAEGARRRFARAGRSSVTVFNSLSWPRRALVRLPEGFEGAQTEAGAALPAQRGADGVYVQAEVPACGWTTLRKAAPARPAAPVAVTPGSLENEHLRVTFNAAGEITRILDKATGRSVNAGACNQFRLYKDVPCVFDAWDIDGTYKQQPVALGGGAKLTVGARGPVFGSLRLRRKLGRASALTQEIVLAAGSRRLDFVTEVDWQESHRLLKVNFPVAVHSEDALHEIQFGHVRRPTHATRAYDAARFEVCNQKWSALAEENGGAAVLNDCKYGVSVEGNSINLTLLRSALAPDMTADKGRQAFTYAFYCWNGPLAGSGLVQSAYELNAPVTAAPGSAGTRSLIEVDQPNVIVETVKPAEDGSGDVVIRLYESMRSTTRCTLRADLPVRSAAETDMLEGQPRALKLSQRGVTLSFRSFEVKTVRLRMA